MDSRVHARFFRVSKPEVGVTDFPDILLEVIATAKAGDRERDIGEGVTVRLERCVANADYLEGEFCRVQTGNFPPQAGPDGLEVIPLGDGKGIGHVAAFSYHRPTRVLLLQRNINSVTSARLSLYLAATKSDRIFGLAPVLAKDAMQRFKSKNPRGFAVTFAGPENLDALDDAGISVAKGAKLIAEAYGGVRVKIEVTVGRSRKKWLQKDSILNDIGQLVDVDGVKRLKVNAAGGGEDDMINFLKEQMQEEQTLQLPEKSPTDNYEMRKLFLRKAFSDNFNRLYAQFDKKSSN
jgi:hypothetical protein